MAIRIDACHGIQGVGRQVGAQPNTGNACARIVVRAIGANILGNDGPAVHHLAGWMVLPCERLLAHLVPADRIAP